jgi:DNA-binding CsgD family transcriptional regulator
VTRPAHTASTSDPAATEHQPNHSEPNHSEPNRSEPNRSEPCRSEPCPPEVAELPPLQGEADRPFGLYRLSPRETQVAILTAEGLSADDLATGLGIKVGTVRNIRQTLRRKLDVPPQLPLNEALNGLFGTIPKDDNASRQLAGIDESPEPGEDRRIHLSVRQAISSVAELAERLDARSAAVASAAQHTPRSRDRLLWEADQLRAIADDLHELEAEAIARVRAHLAVIGRVG